MYKLLCSIVLIFFINYTSCITVVLSGHNGAELKKELFQQYNIEEITSIVLNELQIETIEEDVFTGMKNLKELDFSRSIIPDLPRNIFKDLVSLEKLDLCDSYGSLSEDIFKYNTKLEKLIISSPYLIELPEHIFSKLTKLQTLKLQYSNLESLPENIFENLIELEELYLSDNKITNIPKKLFINNHKLNVLWLHENKISEIHPDTFKNNLQLLYFTLFSNNIKYIKKNTFSHLTNLYGINLYENQITNIEVGAFPSNNMSYIDMGKNKLNYLNPQILLDLEETEDVNICPNPWKCTEKLVNLWKIFKENYPSKLQDCECQEPQIKGKTWRELTEEDFK